MNKIYKVIWSKVKHQYVVVSELAHSNGKQSRTAKRSLRSRIAALVVCGAIAAFGVFGVTEQQAFAGIGQAVEAQYVAIAVDDSNDNGRNNRRFSFDRESYNYHKETLPGTNTTYWVRDGYSIKLEYGYRFPQSQGAADNKQIVAYKTDANADTGGLLQSNQVMIDTSSTSSGEPVTTYTGSILNDVEVGTYVGAVNTSSTETPATFNYYIEDDNGKYIDAGGNPDMGEENHFDERFVEATLNADGSYTVNIDGKNQVVSRDNLYVINDKYKDISGREHDNYKIGVFTTTSNQIYTGRVFGKHNEVLMTAQDKDGNYYSYWAANTDDPNAPLTGMTIGQFNTSLKEIDTNSRKLAGDDIKQIDVTSTGENKGTIGLLRRGTYNEATGEWEGNTYAPGTINITSEAKTGEDTKIRFANEANPDGFTVDAGSRVVGKTGADGTTEANPNDTLTGIEINGQNYKLGGGKIYTDGDGIAIDDENDNKISVRLKDDETNLTVDDTGLALNKDLTVDSVNAKGTTIDEKGLTVGGTTYVSAEGLSAGNKVITNVADGAIDSDAVNLGQLKDVEEKADDAVEVAGKHTIVSTEDNNLTVENVAEEGQAANYEVALNKDLTVDSVNAKGTTIDENGLTVGGTTYVSKEGLNAGGKAITNVANGVIDSDAVNLGQLKDVEEKADDAVDEAGKHTIVSTEDNNLKVENVAEEGQAANYEVALNKDLAVDSVTAGGTTISSTGLTAGKVNVDATTDTVSGLSNISWDSQKADEGYYKNSTKAATEAQLSAVNTTANKGWSLYITDKDGKQTLVKDVKPTNPLVSIDSGENVSITRNEDGNGLTISADLKDLDVEDTNAVLYDKDTNKTSVTLAGGESGTQIHNLADGTKDTDAVNLGQLTDKTGDLQYNTNHYVTNDEDLTISIGKLDNQVFTNTTNITELQNSTIDSGNVDEKGNINLTHTNADNTTTTIASIDGLKDYALKDGQYITKDKSGATLLTLQDQYDPNNTKTVKIDGLATYNIKTENGEVTGIDYGNIRLAGEIARDPETGEIIIDPKTGKEINTGTRITNLKAGYVGKESTDAVNGSQLYAVQQEAGKHTTVTVNGGVEAPEDGSYTNKDGHLDGNLLLKQTNNDGQIQYDIKLNPDVNLTGEGENSDNRVWLSGSNGTITVTTENNLSEKTTVINGGNVYVGSSVSVGDKVEITDKDITGLSNTSWNGTTDDESRAATEGQLKDISTTVNAGWTATDSNGNSIVVNPENGSTLNFAGDRNIEVKANEKDGSIDVSLKDDIVLGGKEDTSRVEIGGTNGTIMATKDPNSMAATTTIDGGNVYVGSSISVGDKVEITDKDITGLSNTSWNGTTDDESRAATEGQLKDVSDTVNAGWTATDSNGNSIVVNPENESTLNFAGDRNIDVKANKEDSSIDVSLDDDIVLGGKEGTSRVEIGGTNGTIMATKDPNSMVATTTIDGGNVYVGSSISVGDKVEITDKDITGLSNTEWNGTTTTPDRAATEGQLQDVAIEAAKHTTVSGDKNITVKHEEDSQDYQVTLNDKVYLGGDHTEDSHNIVLDGDRGVIGLGSTIALDGRDGTAVIGGVNITTTSEEETGKAVSTITGLSNTTWEGTTETPDRAATEGQLQSVATEAAKHTTVSGDENITVKHEEGSQDYQVTLNPDVTLKGDNSSIELNGTKGTMQVNQETAEGTNFTNINGNVVSIGYTNSEGIENAIVIDGGKGTITGLSNTTWDDELAKQVANSEELQGTAATQGQLQQAVNEVAEVANAGWNAKAGGNTINVKPNETLNFEGDGNITVSATSGTSSELKFGLNHNITLDNVKDKNTMLVINTDGREGYIPDNYKDSNEDAEDFIGKHGGFAIYYANPSLTTGDMTGTFGVTTDGVVHAKDVISYYSASSGSQSDVIRYSLNDVGDIVTQISHAVFDEGVGKTGMEYTLISDFEDEADKDSPFDAKEGKTRTIGLAVRQDGAVIVGAVVNDEGISRDRGIRINAETKTTYDKNGNEVTNNIATITGLENTEWKPPTPVATLAANDGSATVTSRAATESQLNDLYSAVAAYDVNVDGTIDYSHIALAGTPYGASRSGNGTPTGGTSITNVAYASGKDGSEAVNVDYLNDAINNAVKDGGAISDSDRHLQEGTYHVNDQGKVELIVADEKGENQSTVTIDNIANKNDITNLDNKIDNTFNDLNDKINNIDNVETDVKGGNINEDGTISLKTENEDGTTTNVTLKGQLTDSGVVQEGTTFDKETGTLTITSQDKYSGETSSVTVEGIASTEVVGATTKEDLATAYKDADKDGNATTEYITDSESMVEADVALDHAIQDVAGTSYANDMVLSNRIDSVEKRLGNVEERIDKVGAMAAAIANLRTMGFDPEAPTEIAIGVGQYKSETGIAIGVFHYPNQDFMLSASLSSSGDELMGGIGATWKLGRKSAAERAKDEEARHLEQAEEMKKLAQQEKVKAQAQRHAKLLAERQQASQKNA